MSADDFLSRATQKLREAPPPNASEVAATRARVMDTLRKSERRRSRVVWLVLPVAAVLVGSTALAKNGEGARQLWHGIAVRVGLVNDRVAPAVARATAPVAPSNVAAAPIAAPIAHTPELVAPPPTPEIAAPVVLAPAQPVAAREARAPRAAAPSRPQDPPEAVESPAPPSAANAAPSEDATALGLFREAYQLHFTQQRYADAIAAWDRYLASSPRGHLVTEARYNRAIALLRVGRQAEARTALAPFARGEVAGGYRAREAKALLGALDQSDADAP